MKRRIVQIALGDKNGETLVALAEDGTVWTRIGDWFTDGEGASPDWLSGWKQVAGLLDEGPEEGAEEGTSAMTDARRVAAVDHNQWQAKCVEFQQWEIVVAHNANGPIVVKGTSWRTVVDAAMESGWSA